MLDLTYDRMYRAFAIKIKSYGALVIAYPSVLPAPIQIDKDMKTKKLK